VAGWCRPLVDEPAGLGQDAELLAEGLDLPEQPLALSCAVARAQPPKPAVPDSVPADQHSDAVQDCDELGAKTPHVPLGLSGEQAV
jgi:hypothetical protein